ncbi:MAG TPA: hypothetical protein PK079_07865 [Leptospiraceae bacterium]|nr:hypothetical protein [Leptospiraceae bacterium]HMW07398.1 hypothetical protein [Leptospiraceae bacterium]HMY32461.1 hypothetical protein [Leptospiraceae bacterium]HMZ67076.1 hypothetical protein [Leptospiraceae bacterium]HNA08469.1 hypothetical protein [Leptospiraceae bacterium]
MRQTIVHFFTIRKVSFLAFLTTLILGNFTTILAEEVLLKNGTIVFGRISKISSDEILLDTAKGNQSIPKKDIVRIRHTPLTAEQKANISFLKNE